MTLNPPLNYPNSYPNSNIDSEIMGNVKVFFLAGSDTTSVVITWAMYEFCVNPVLLKQVQEEVDSVMKGSTDYTTAVMERKLPLCAACFVETVRLRGPVPFALLNTAGTEPVTLSNGIVVNPGDDVHCNFDAVHMDPQESDPLSSYCFITCTLMTQYLSSTSK